MRQSPKYRPEIVREALANIRAERAIVNPVTHFSLYLTHRKKAQDAWLTRRTWNMSFSSASISMLPTISLVRLSLAPFRNRVAGPSGPGALRCATLVQQTTTSPPFSIPYARPSRTITTIKHS